MDEYNEENTLVQDEPSDEQPSDLQLSDTETSAPKRPFLRGFLLGLLLMAVICGTAFLALRGGSEDQPAAELPPTDPDRQRLLAAEDSPTVTEFQDKLREIEDLINRRFIFDYDTETLINGMYEGLVNSLNDKYSAYYDTETYKSILESNTGRYEGIGALVSQDPDTGVISVVSVFKGSPAEKAGLLEGDRIVRVEGTEVTGMDLSVVTGSYLKGESGTNVVITVQRGEEELDVTVTRGTVDIQTVDYTMLEDSVGYILVSEFADVTIGQFNDALNDLLSLGMKGLVLDLRGNPGGLTTTAVDMADRFLPEDQVVFYTQEKDGSQMEFRTADPEKVDVPVIILVNGGSASSAELFSGCLRDYGVAKLLGETTFGKGIVQTYFYLNDYSALKITTAKYYTPNGYDIHGTGLVPDYQIDPEDNADGEPKDNQLEQALRIMKEEING